MERGFSINVYNSRRTLTYLIEIHLSPDVYCVNSFVCMGQRLLCDDEEVVQRLIDYEVFVLNITLHSIVFRTDLTSDLLLPFSSLF